MRAIDRGGRGVGLMCIEQAFLRFTYFPRTISEGSNLFVRCNSEGQQKVQRVCQRLSDVKDFFSLMLVTSTGFANETMESLRKIYISKFCKAQWSKVSNTVSKLSTLHASTCKPQKSLYPCTFHFPLSPHKSTQPSDPTAAQCQIAEQHA